MARIRSIKPEFWTSEQVVDCSTTARLLFIGMWNFCDDSGIHPASYRRLKMEVFPGDDITAEDIKKLLQELKDSGLVIEYSVEDQTFWRVTGWKHQRIEKPNFRYPLENGRRPVDDQSTTTPRLVDDRSPPEGIGEDRSIGEGSVRGGEKRRFLPPTVEQVREYVSERQSSVDPQRFVDHYAAKGWRVGKTPMKDWKAAVRTWERNDSPQPVEAWR